MAIKTWVNQEVLTISDLNTFAANGGLKMVGEMKLNTIASLSNVFTSEFANYRVVCDYLNPRSTAFTNYFNVVLTVNGSDSGLGQYFTVIQQIDVLANQINPYIASANSWALGRYGGNGLGQVHSFVFDLYNPQKNIYTTISSRGAGIVSGTSRYCMQNMCGVNRTNTQFDGIRVGDFTDGSRGTGAVRIYGYRQP